MKLNSVGKTNLEISELGVGTAPHGGLYSVVTQQMASESILAAINSGCNYIDTAPLYGFGQAEIYLKDTLKDIPRDTFIISTKVGRGLRKLSKDNSDSRSEFPDFFLNAAPYDTYWDFSYDGIRQSFEGSLDRMGLDKINILYIHMLPESYDEVLNSAYPAVEKLKEEGLVDAIGIGVDFVEPLVKFLKADTGFDIFMLAGRYTLLDTSALNELIPLCLTKGVSLSLAAPYNSGILAAGLNDELTTDSKYWYADVPDEVLNCARSIKAVCDSYQIPLKSVALQFGTASEVVASTVPGARNSHEAKENAEMIGITIPDDLWDELKSNNLIPADCQVP